MTGDCRHPHETVIELFGVTLEMERIAHRMPDRPTLIFLHEGLGCVELWRDFPHQLCQLAGCPGLVYSRQGYGRSDPCDLPRPPSYLHDEALSILPKLLETEGIDKYVLIGHSDGASIALIHAARAIPGHLLGVISMAPHVFCEPMSVAAIARVQAAFRNGDLRRRLSRYHGANVDCAFTGWAETWQSPGFEDWNIEHELSVIQAPQLVIQGVDDEYGSAAHCLSIEERAPGPVDVKMLTNCGHSPHQDQPALTRSAMLDFLRRAIH